jgi:polyhydroxyalkanoate synthesis regulator protein
MQAFLPSYLELSLASFADQQERLRQQMTGATPAAGLAVYEEQVKKNMVLFSQAMQMFSPFAYGKPEAQAAPAAEAPPPASPASEDAIADLKRRMEEMAAQIDRLASGR